MSLLLHGVQIIRYFVNRHVILREWGSVGLSCFKGGHLACQTLHHVADGHARGNGVWVHDHVRYDAFLRKWHVFLPLSDAARALLAVSTSELVSNLRHSYDAHLYFAVLFPFVVSGQNATVHDSRILRADEDTGVFEGLTPLVVLLCDLLLHLRNPTDNHIPFGYSRPWLH